MASARLDFVSCCRSPNAQLILWSASESSASRSELRRFLAVFPSPNRVGESSPHQNIHTHAQRASIHDQGFNLARSHVVAFHFRLGPKTKLKLWSLPKITKQTKTKKGKLYPFPLVCISCSALTDLLVQLRIMANYCWQIISNALIKCQLRFVLHNSFICHSAPLPSSLALNNLRGICK